MQQRCVKHKKSEKFWQKSWLKTEIKRTNLQFLSFIEIKRFLTPFWGVKPFTWEKQGVISLLQIQQTRQTSAGLAIISSLRCRIFGATPLERTAAVTPESSRCRSVIRSPTFISMGLRKNRHFSFLDGSGTSSTRRPRLYSKDKSAKNKYLCLH